MWQVLVQSPRMNAVHVMKKEPTHGCQRHQPPSTIGQIIIGLLAIGGLISLAITAYYAKAGITGSDR